MKRLKMDAIQLVLDTTSNDFTCKVLPHYNKWCPQYDRRVRDSVRDIIKRRLNSTNSECNYGDDLLGLMIEASENTESNKSTKLNMDEIVEECKTFFLAGHETSSNLLTWTVFLLSLHQDWQTRLKEEVLKECGMGIPDSDRLARLRLVVLSCSRNVQGSIKRHEIGELDDSKECTSINSTCKDPQEQRILGEDANEFNPNRFTNGISRQQNTQMLFSPLEWVQELVWGKFCYAGSKSSSCNGSSEVSLSLSSDYKHAPVDNITLQPQHASPLSSSL
ncbi:hypothetical protein GH714_038094 [Hevea brasiliensis]|uniref:Cytochrome P450 n=1 Tax=Hevea brasiliensis TaxID=3981 RepID=A0A6A6LWD8_HEVBR|nr:hypothetical protein GH714_038094 [Hevea brasiliensis]